MGLPGCRYTAETLYSSTVKHRYSATFDVPPQSAVTNSSAVSSFDNIYIKVKWSRYRPGVAQRVGRGIALLFHDHGTRRGVSGQQHAPAALYPGKEPVPILQEAGWAPGIAWTDGKSRSHRCSIPDRPGRSQSLYRLSYAAHTHVYMCVYIYIYIYIYRFACFLCGLESWSPVLRGENRLTVFECRVLRKTF